MSSTNSNREFKVLSDRDHVLQRSGMYIGGSKLVDQEQWILNRESSKFEFKTVKVVPGFLKIVNEIIDNSIDVAIDTKFDAANKISVKVDAKSVEVIDNGIGIPVRALSKEDKRTLPEIAWTTLRSGTSFGDDREKIGTNGLGSVATNIFSKVFIGTSDDGSKKQTIKCSDNMAEVKVGSIKPSSGKSGVTVYFEPDLERFGLSEIDETHQGLIYQRLLNLAISFPKIKFSYNGKQINISEKKFAQMFSDNALIESCDNTTICVFPNEYDEFKFYAQVNGLNTFRGGSHVDYITNEIATRVRDKLIKKYKNIRPGDIKNKICIAIILTGFKNPEFDSQTKENLKNAPSDVSHHINGKIDFDSFSKKVLKSDAIIEPIVEMFKLKEELKARQELKTIKKIRVTSDKYMASTTDKKYCLLCEGLSARGGLSSALGRKGFSYFAGRGVPLNAYDAKVQAISANQELKDIASILELDLFGKEEKKTIAFEKVILANDADMDGIFIANQYVGWFTRFAPNLFNEHKVARLITPLVILRNKKDDPIKYFYSLNDFKAYEQQNDLSKFKIDYKKGLGSWPKEEFIELFEKYGFEYFVQDLLLDDEGKVYVDNWLNGEKADMRKEYLREFTLNIETM